MSIRATIVRTNLFRPSLEEITFAIRWCVWRRRSIGTSWEDAPVRSVALGRGSHRCRHNW